MSQSQLPLCATAGGLRSRGLILSPEQPQLRRQDVRVMPVSSLLSDSQLTLLLTVGLSRVPAHFEFAVFICCRLGERIIQVV